MAFLVLIENEETELADCAAVRAAFVAGRIDAATWIKELDVESDWQTVEEMFPELTEGGEKEHTVN